MSPNSIVKALSFALVTTFVLPSLAGQPPVKSQNETPAKVQKMPAEFKHLPLILDSKKIDLEKFKKGRAESLKDDKAFGPGSSGGGNLCAANITEAVAFIVKNFDQIPLLTESQRRDLKSKIASAAFLAGENLEVGGQAVNAINYPALNVVVVNSQMCERLSRWDFPAFALLLHEYLGLARIDDRTYQVSQKFLSKVQNLEPQANTKAALKKQIRELRLKIAKTEDTIANSYASEGAFADPVSELSKVIVLSSTQASKRLAELNKAIQRNNDAIRGEEDIAGDSGNEAYEQAQENMVFYAEIAAIYRGELAKALKQVIQPD